VIGLRRFDCAGLVVPGKDPVSLLATVIFLARWSDGDDVTFSLGNRAS
jgi:hypothetical protein